MFPASLSQPWTVSSNPQWFCSTKSSLLSEQGLVSCSFQVFSGTGDVSQLMEHVYVHYKPPCNTLDTLPQTIRVGCSPGKYLSCRSYIRSFSFSFFRLSCELGTEHNKDNFNAAERAKYRTYTHSSAWPCCNAEHVLTAHTAQSHSVGTHQVRSAAPTQSLTYLASAVVLSGWGAHSLTHSSLYL